jgi:hypothetical protein
LKLSRTIGIGAFFLVTLGLIAGFLAAGSPQHARQLALDSQRACDLQALTEAIAEHARGVPGAMLPAHLPASYAGQHGDGSSAAADPVTHRPYEYQRIGPQRYRVCATFALASETAANRIPNWQHGAGRQCFERRIDGDALKGLPSG